MIQKSRAALLIVIALSACQQKNTPPPGSISQQPSMKVQGYVVVARELKDVFNVTGTLLASEQTELRPEVSGRVTALTLKEGSTVHSGQLLVKLYDADLQAQLQKLEVQVEIAKKNEQRLRELLSVSGTSQQELEMAQLQTSNIAADISIVKSSLSKTEIRAPFSGKLGLRNISPGAYVTPSTVVATIREVGRLKLDFDIPEKYGHLISGNQAVRFTVAGVRDTFDARVIASEADVNEQSRTLKIRSLTTSTSDRLFPGAFANVSLSLSSNLKALMIPTQALIPQARDKRVIIVKEGKAKFVTVTTGYRTNDAVEITSGISDGDTVVTTGLLFIKPDARVDFSSFVK